MAITEHGACCDGLQPQGVNRNQGAESTLAWLWTAVHQDEIRKVLGDDRRGIVNPMPAADGPRLSDSANEPLFEEDPTMT